MGQGQLWFCSPLFASMEAVPFSDYRDQLELPDSDWFHEPLTVETRQCLALHAGAALADEGEDRIAAAVRLRLEMLKESVNAFGHLGDAPPYVSEAEAFIRHNAHDAYYPHHEKDYRLLALFAPQFMRGAQLLVLRLSQAGRLEGDLVRGQGATTRYGTVLIHRGHTRHVPVDHSVHQALLSALESSGRLIREVQAAGWPTYLDSMESLGEFLSSKPSPCIRCHRPQTQCKVGLPVSEAPWDPALSPVLPDTVPLKDRPQFAKGVYVQEVFAGWGGWTSGMLHQGFRADPPIEYYEDPLHMSGPRPEFDIRDATVRAKLLDKARVPPDADVPNLWEWGTPCTTYCDYQRLNGGTRTVQPSSLKEMAVEPMRFRETSSRSSLVKCAWSCTAQDGFLALKAAPPPGSTQKFGTCPACADFGRRPALASFQCTCALGFFSLTHASRTSITGRLPGGWFLQSCFRGCIFSLLAAVRASPPSILMSHLAAPATWLASQPLVLRSNILCRLGTGCPGRFRTVGLAPVPDRSLHHSGT